MRVEHLLKHGLALLGAAALMLGAGLAQAQSDPASKPSQKARAADQPGQTAQGARSVQTAQSAQSAQSAQKKPKDQAGTKGQVARSAKKPPSSTASAKSLPASKARNAPRATVRQDLAPARASFGQRAGLHGTADPLDLKSSVALVVDQETQQVLYSKNPDAVLPIASITKLMTAMVVLEAGLPLEERLSISQEDVDTEKGSGSRLRVGTLLSRGDMLHLALMASENRAANALGRHFPGGMPVFVEAMNRKARTLGMGNTRYVEPTGLSSANQSSAHDLSLLVRAAFDHQLIRDLSTSTDASVNVGSKAMQFRNTNGLIRNPTWEIGLQKTGYISEAGRCVVMQAQMAGRKLIMVLLDSAGRYSRIGDAERLRNWVMHSVPAAQAAAVPPSGG